MFNSVAKNQWLAAFLPSGLLVLLVPICADLGGALPEPPTARPRTALTPPVRPVAKIAELFSAASLGRLAPSTNAANPFYTTYFQPPPPPPPPPVAPKPTTRKISLVYQGFYQTAAGLKKAFVQADDRLLVEAVGNPIIGDLVVIDIGLRALTLKNSAARTNVLEFNIKQEVEIPAP